MATLLALQVKRSGEWVTDRKRDVEEGDEGSATAERKKRRKQEEEDSTPPVTAGLPGRRPCASVIIRLQHKEGVAWRNTEAGQSDGEAGLTLCFSARVAAIGPVVTWEHDPKNGAMTDKEVEPQEEVRKLERCLMCPICPSMPLCHCSFCSSRCCVCCLPVLLLAGLLSSSLGSSTDSSLPTPR